MSVNYGSKRLVVGAHYGMRDWLSQRVTAALMALFTLIVLALMIYVILRYRRAANPVSRIFARGVPCYQHGRKRIMVKISAMPQTYTAQAPGPRGRKPAGSSRPQGWQVDGDHLGTATGLRLRSVPHALRVVS